MPEMTHALRQRLFATLFLTLLWAPTGWAMVLELSDAEFVLSDASKPPDDAAPWRAQRLPDRWRASRPTADAIGWYRLRFPLAEPNASLYAVYLPGLGLNAAVYLNGTPIGDGGRFDEPIARNWNRPLLFLIPPGLLRAGENALYVRLRSHAYTQANLEPILIGADQLLRPAYEREYFLRVTLNQTTTVLIAAIGILMLNLWWRRRRDTYYGYFGLSALLWTLQSANLYMRDVPVPTAAWEIIVNSGVQVFSAFLLVSLLRFARIDWKPLTRFILAAIVAAPVTLALVPATHFFKLTAFWHMYTFAGGVGTLALLLHASLARGNRDARMLVGAMGVVLLLAAHDWLIHSQDFWSINFHWPLGDVFLLHYSAPVVFLSVGLIMTGRFARVLNEFESLNNELEVRVKNKHTQLEQSFARMKLLETERAVSEERERIYRDLHDDVGAKLLSLVYRAGTPATAELARSALQDLRDVVSRTAAADVPLEELAADWHAECDQRLTEAAMRLDWRQSGVFDGIALSQPQALDISRVLREAVSNAIKHSGAAVVVVAVGVDGDTLRLEVCDDGVGYDGAASHGGRGVQSMDERAKRLHAKLVRHSVVPHGHRIALDVPLASHRAQTTRT